MNNGSTYIILCPVLNPPLFGDLVSGNKVGLLPVVIINVGVVIISLAKKKNRHKEDHNSYSQSTDKLTIMTKLNNSLCCIIIEVFKLQL